MSQFTFNRGTWEEGSPIPEWKDDEEHKEYVSRIGYQPRQSNFGHEDSGEVEIYESTHDKSFYANICPLGGSCFDVFLPDFPSLMIFLRDYASVFSVISVNSVQQQILDILEKFFQAEHGHPAFTICDKCDPEGWEKWQKLSQERSNRKAERN